MWYPKGAKFELVGYSDSDYVGCKVERKSTSGTCVGTEDQLVDIFTKPLDEKRFCKLTNELNILDFSNMC